LKVNPRPRVGRLKIRLRPCQDHDWPAMSGPCLTRPCCQDYFKTISRPCLTRPCLSRPFWQDLVFRYHVMTNLIHFVHWASLDQISPFGSDLIKFDQVWSSLIKFGQIWSKKIQNKKAKFLRFLNLWTFKMWNLIQIRTKEF
jgi:hypothetical protein